MFKYLFIIISYMHVKKYQINAFKLGKSFVLNIVKIVKLCCHLCVAHGWV